MTHLTANGGAKEGSGGFQALLGILALAVIALTVYQYLH